MNRTEHKIRMCFDPEYAEKYERFAAEKSRLIRLNVSVFAKSGLPVIAGPLFTVVLHSMVRPSVAYALMPLALMIILIPLIILFVMIFTDIRKEYKSLNF